MATAPTSSSAAPGRYKATLPFYHGVSDTLKAKDYITMVERCKGVQNWSNQAALNAAALNLRGAAYQWSALYFREAGLGAETDWNGFRTAFIARFHRTTTVTEVQQQLSLLKQKSNESVDDFMDRIDTAMYELSGFNISQSVHFFLAGALPNLKSFLEANDLLETKEQFRKAARSWEIANVSRQRRQELSALRADNTDVYDQEPSVHENDSTLDDDDEFSSTIERLAAMYSNRGRSRFGRSRFGRGRNYRGTPSTRGATATPGKGPPTQQLIKCFSCRRYGTHIARDCPIPKHIVATMKNLDPHPEDVEQESGSPLIDVQESSGVEETFPIAKTSPSGDEGLYVLNIDTLNM
jgi:hypothetical protein